VVRRRRRGRAGIAVYMGPGRALGIELRRKRVVAWRSAPGGQRVLGRARAGRRAGLRLRAKDGQAFGFELATRRGWRQVGPAGYTPPWWIGVSRVVLRTAGPARGRGLFERFAIRPEE
jgi:hypothetical protein